MSKNNIINVSENTNIPLNDLSIDHVLSAEDITNILACRRCNAEDFIEILGDELNDDYAKLAGLSSEEYLIEPIYQSIKKEAFGFIFL